MIRAIQNLPIDIGLVLGDRSISSPNRLELASHVLLETSNRTRTAVPKSKFASIAISKTVSEMKGNRGNPDESDKF